MALQSISQCFCDNTYGTYEKLDLRPEENSVCGSEGDACGQNNAAYPGDSCQMTNAVFILPSWTCSDVTCDAGTAAVAGAATVSALGESDADMQARCCDISCAAWNAGGNVCDAGTRFMTRLSDTVVAGTNSQASCCTAPCAAGTWNNAGRCEPCSAGKISTTSTIDPTECTECVAGEYAAPRAISCVACVVGQYDHDRSAATPCKNCAPGSYSDFTGAFSCDGQCPVGSFGAAGTQSSDDCAACASGQHDHDLDATTPCLLCLPGFFSEAVGQSACTACAAGLTSIGGSVSCSPPQPSFVEEDCPAERAACLRVSGCEEALAVALAAPSQPTAGSVELLAVLECVALATGSAAATADAIMPTAADRNTAALGCVDPSASNYDATKAANDGSCAYDCSALTADAATEPTDEQCYIYSRERAAWESDPPRREAAVWAQLAAVCHVVVQGVAPAASVDVDEKRIVACNCNYELNPIELSWAEAEVACVLGGGHLASGHSPEEFDIIDGLIDNDGGSAWIGLNDREYEMGAYGGYFGPESTFPPEFKYVRDFLQPVNCPTCVACNTGYGGSCKNPGMIGSLSDGVDPNTGAPLCEPPSSTCTRNTDPPDPFGFVWTDGSTLDYTLWEMGAPTGSPYLYDNTGVRLRNDDTTFRLDQDCVYVEDGVLQQTSSETGQAVSSVHLVMNDDGCDTLKKSICGFRARATHSTSRLVPQVESSSRPVQ